MGTTSAIRIRVVIVIRIAIVTGGMPVADGLVVVAVVAEDDRRTRALAATLAVLVVEVVLAVEVALVNRWHATVVITGRGVV